MIPSLIFPRLFIYLKVQPFVSFDRLDRLQHTHLRLKWNHYSTQVTEYQQK